MRWAFKLVFLRDYPEENCLQNVYFEEKKVNIFVNQIKQKTSGRCLKIRV